ncbi:uncharacterized threonine-rich GPI-anchored glycoprotein PJ4664.02-like [Chiloscyllium plagiosum]|uniref:uncharacterized threonine-rich GPI-anchored glycoprotein PJ4664.02-like n=1 Tax=Chiloscyllium plagiosum TaxID=36176 RepID=UPI001CB7C851|nr:uncharacterized threonine-rich GPI-anchored glycoprotein PJ4664.02-like [Chiloscyllium plagiosum]
MGLLTPILLALVTSAILTNATEPTTTTGTTTSEPTTTAGTTASEPTTTAGTTTPEPTTTAGTTASEPTTTAGTTTSEPTTTAGTTASEPSTTAGTTASEPTTTAGTTASEPTTTAGTTTPKATTTAGTTASEPTTTAGTTTPEPTTTAGTTASEPTTTAGTTASEPTTTAGTTTPEPTTTAGTTPEPTTTAGTTTPEATTTAGTTASEPTTTAGTTTPEPTTTAGTTASEPTTTAGTTTSEPTTTTTGTTTPEPTTTTTGTTTETTFSATTSITTPPTSTVAPVTVPVTRLEFRLDETFTPGLSNPNSDEFRNLAVDIEATLGRIYRRRLLNFIRARVNSFSPGSIAVNSSLFFEENTQPLSPSETVKVLANEVNNSTNLGNLSVIQESIQSESITVNNLEPVSLNILFVIENVTFTDSLTSNTSSDFTSLRDAVVSWLENVLRSGFSPEVLPNSRVVFSNASSKVKVAVHVQINTTKIEDRPFLRDLIINNVNSSGFDIIRSTVQVNGQGLEFDRIPVALRFETTTFTIELNDRSTPEFIALSSRVTNVINSVFGNDPNFTEVVINGFRNGSTIADVTTVFSFGTTKQSTVTQTIIDNSETFVKADFSLDINFLMGTTTTIPAMTTTRTSTPTTRSTVSTTSESPTTANATQASTTANTTQASTTANTTQTSTTAANVTQASTAAANVTQASTAAVNVTEASTTTANTTQTSTTVNVTEASTTANTTQASTTANVTPAPTTTANVLVTPVTVALNGTFTPALSNSNSPEFQNLRDSVERQLTALYRRRAPTGFRGYRVIRFRSGSIESVGQLEYDTNATPLSSSEAVKVLANAAENNQTLGNLTIITTSIRSGSITVNNLEPVSLNILFVIENVTFTDSLTSNTSSDFTSLRDAVVSWLENVLRSGFSPEVLPNSRVVFSNASSKVQVTAFIQINTTKLEDRPFLRDLIINNVNTSGLDIIRSTVQVNGDMISFQSFSLVLRFTNRNFVDALNNRSSAEFKELSTTVTNVMNNIFQNNPNFIEVIIDEFRDGSVMAISQAIFLNNTTQRSDVIQQLVDNTATFSSANLSLDTNSLIGATTTTAPMTTSASTTTVNQPPPDTPFPGFAIAIIVMCLLAIIAIPILIVVFVKTGFCSKVANAFRLEGPDDLDMKLPMFGGRSYNFQ